MGARWATHQGHPADVRSRLGQVTVGKASPASGQGFACVEARFRLLRLCVRITDHARLRLRRARLRQESTAFVMPKMKSTYQVSTGIYRHSGDEVSTLKHAGNSGLYNNLSPRSRSIYQVSTSIYQDHHISIIIIIFFFVISFVIAIA